MLQVADGGDFFREPSFLENPRVPSFLSSDIGFVHVPFGDKFALKDKAPAHNAANLDLKLVGDVASIATRANLYDWPYRHSNISAKTYAVENAMGPVSPVDVPSITLETGLTDKTARQALAPLLSKRVLHISSAHNVFCGFENAKLNTAFEQLTDQLLHNRQVSTCFLCVS